MMCLPLRIPSLYTPIFYLILGRQNRKKCSPLLGYLGVGKSYRREKVLSSNDGLFNSHTIVQLREFYSKAIRHVFETIHFWKEERKIIATNAAWKKEEM